MLLRGSCVAAFHLLRVLMRNKQLSWVLSETLNSVGPRFRMPAAPIAMSIFIKNSTAREPLSCASTKQSMVQDQMLIDCSPKDRSLALFKIDSTLEQSRWCQTARW